MTFDDWLEYINTTLTDDERTIAKAAWNASAKTSAKLCEILPCVRYEPGTAELRAWNEGTIDCKAAIIERSNVEVTGGLTNPE